jgi:signal transduction histidine kinase
MITTGFGHIIAERMQAEHARIAARWFERLSVLVPVDASQVFPTSSLLDHIPALIAEIGAYIQTPEDEAIAANTGVLDKARELGILRHDQRASLHQVLREYQLLGAVLVAFIQEEIGRLKLNPPPGETVAVVSRLHQSVHVLMQATVETFVELYTKTIAEQAERLREFTGIATHEWRQPLASLQFAVSLLRRTEADSERAHRTLDVMDRNVAHLVEVTRKVEVVARLTGERDDPVVQEVSASTVAAEAARQLREMADARDVEIRVAENLPTLTVDVGRLELALLNLVSNGIKYADPDKPHRFVEVTGAAGNDRRCRIAVRDNGIGIPADRLASIFERFTRAHADRDGDLKVTGLGLGLSIAADCVRTMGGHLEVESQEHQGTTFVLTLPLKPLSQTAEPSDSPR